MHRRFYSLTTGTQMLEHRRKIIGGMTAVVGRARERRRYNHVVQGHSSGFCQARCFLGGDGPPSLAIIRPCASDQCSMLAAHGSLSRMFLRTVGSCKGRGLAGVGEAAPFSMHLHPQKDEKTKRRKLLASRKCSHAVCKTTAGLQKTRKRHRSPKHREWRSALARRRPRLDRCGQSCQ